MGMIKVIQPNSQDFSEPVASLIKVSSRGIIGNDRTALVKRAGAEFVSKLDNIKFAKDEVPVHLIAIGATEDYGPNRNGDGFKRACCKQYHDTFVKHARFYRDHLNKNPAKSYGLVKASAYHEPMRRIELICALNSTKEAADRNGGLVADKEMEKLARGDDIGVSMACTIPFDVCSHCGNQAKTRAEYCDSPENGGHCKAGGLKHNMGKCASDGSVLYADNPNPRFFDISHVFRPADRIAYISGQLKAASAFVSGAELAERLGVTAPLSLNAAEHSTIVLEQLSALEKLAQAEAGLTAGDYVKTALAEDSAVCAEIKTSAVSAYPLGDVLRALADAAVILPPADFFNLTVKSAGAELLAAVNSALPGVFIKMAADPNIVSSLAQNAYNPSYAAGDKLNAWAQKVAATKSVLPKAVEKRAYLAVLRETKPRSPETFSAMTKQSANNSAAVNALARHYAMYKIAAFAEIVKKHDAFGLTAPYCVMQNYVM